MNVNHIRYLRIKGPVCMSPEKLGMDAVVYDYDGTGPACPECKQLLLVHNIREEVHEKLRIEDLGKPPVGKFWVGVVNSCLATLILWVVIAAVIFIAWLVARG